MNEVDTTLLDELLLTVQRAIYTRVAPLEITGWVTTEPVPFAARTSGVEKSMPVGQPWAEQLFDCAWVRFRGVVPADPAEDPLVARIDINGELCLVDETGRPVRGLTCIKSTYDRTLGGPGKTVYRLPATLARRGPLELWGDAGFNDLFGAIPEEGALALAEIATCREDVRQLYYDLETLRDYAKGLAEDEETVGRLAGEIAGIARELDCSNRDSVARARARLQPWFKSGIHPSLRVHAIGHAHIDLAWLWPIRETFRKGARTFASALYNLEHYPEYVYGCSQPQLFAWMKAHYPDLYPAIKAAVKAGRIEPLGNCWVEPDCNMPSGETLVRQIIHGERFFREEFGTAQAYCWQPDVFGYHGQMPQILRRSGHAYFMTQKLSWNVVNRFGHHSFHWEGIDGTSILTHMLPEETYNGPAAPRSLKKIAAEYAERAVSGHALMVFGIGDGGGGPDAEHLERLRRAPGLAGMPAVTQEPAANFFAAWSRDADKFPRWRGELYLERHQGTLTTQARVKRYNRFAEIALRETEWAAFLAAQYADVAYPAAALDRLWKEVLLYQFHDILPGSSIKRVYDECHARYEIILAELAALKNERYAAVAARIFTEATVAFNSLSWPRHAWLKHDGAWRRLAIPAFGWSVVTTAAAASTSPIAEPGRLENEQLRVIFADDGRIQSIFDRRTQREVIAPGELANVFVVFQDKGDAWDFETDYEKKDVWRYLDQPAQYPVLQSAVATVDGPCASLEQVWSFGQSEILQTIRLMAESDQLVFDTRVNWRETAMMLRVKFPVAVQADEARFEIPFGSIRRSTREDTSLNRAQLEVAALQWLDLSQADYGVAVLNDCKYGFRVKGHTLDLNLLRSVPHPGSALIGKDSKSGSAAGSVYTDLAVHSFRYALWPHSGPGDAARLTQAAREFNTPLQLSAADSFAAVGQKSSLPPHPIRISHAGIELAAIKPAEDGEGWAVRLVNVTDQAIAADIVVAQAGNTLAECDLLERGAKPLSADRTGRTPLQFGPFEIKTLRWTPSPEKTHDQKS